MPNQHSKAKHHPIRTCVVCKSKHEQSALLSFFILDNSLIIDVKRQIQVRKSYVCPQVNCLGGLDKWKLRYLKKNGKSRAFIAQAST